MTISGNDGVLNLMDLPTEVIELGLFPYLKHVELKRMKLNRRLTGIAHSVMEKRYRKCKLLGNYYKFYISRQILYNCILASTDSDWTDYDDDGDSDVGYPAVEHEIINIKEPLRNLKNKLETKLTIDLAHYDIYLRGT